MVESRKGRLVQCSQVGKKKMSSNAQLQNLFSSLLSRGLILKRRQQVSVAKLIPHSPDLQGKTGSLKQRPCRLLAPACSPPADV